MGAVGKPAAPADGLDVCGIHPRGFVCDEDAPTSEEMNGELANCGAPGYGQTTGLGWVRRISAAFRFH